MELFPLVAGGGGIGDFPLNAYHVKDDFEIGIGKNASIRSLFGYFSELEHEFKLECQPKRGFDLNSVPDEFDNDNVFLQVGESLKTAEQFNMVQNHVAPFEEGDVMMEELTPTPNRVDDFVFPFKEGDVVMEDLALPLNMVYDHVVSCEKGDVIMEELAPIANMVPDHVVSSEARDVIMEDVTPVTLPDRVVSYQEEELYNEEAEESDDDEDDEEEELHIICPPGVVFSG